MKAQTYHDRHHLRVDDHPEHVEHTPPVYAAGSVPVKRAVYLHTGSTGARNWCSPC